MDCQSEPFNPLVDMDGDELLSRLIIADRQQNFEELVEIRREVMYRLRCAEPLINWYQPSRRDNNNVRSSESCDCE